MPQQILLRKGTAAAWSSANPVLAAGEPGFETNTGKFKIGNGTTAWNALAYAVGDIPADISDLTDTGNLIPENLADLADVAATTPTTGQVLKWNGTAWAPAADDAGSGGGGATVLDDLTDVIITGTPTTGQVLKWNGSSWINSSDTDTNTTYSVLSQTKTGGARITLRPSSGSDDSVNINSGLNVTVENVDENALSISAVDTKYALSAETDVGTGDVRFQLVDSVSALQQNMYLLAGGNATVSRASSTAILINSKNTLYTQDTGPVTNGVSLSYTGTNEATGLQATLDSATAVVTLTSGTTKGLTTGLRCNKTSGTGAFATGATILSIDSSTQFTMSAVHATSGAVTFNVTSVNVASFLSPTDGGIAITNPSEGVIQFVNTNGKVTTGVSTRLAMYADPANLTTLAPSNDGLTYDNTTRYLVVTSGRLALRQSDLQMLHNSYGTGARSDGLQYAQYFGSTAESRAWNIIRARGTSTAPTAISSGDEIFELRGYGQYGTGANDLTIAANMRFVARTVNPGFVGGDIIFATGDGTAVAAPKLIIREAGHVEINSIKAIGTGGNGDLELAGIGTGTVRLPAGTTVGGVGIGTLSFAGTTANATTRAALTPSSGQVYIQQDNLHGYLWDGSAWIDLDVIQGPAGAAGTNGTNGTAATVAVGTVTTGAAGSSASVTNSGTSLAATLNFTIPRGDTGETGAAATIAVGTVTTGAAGSSASVTNSGTSGAAVFDFTIPQGADGNDGADGADGQGVIVGGTAGQVLAKIDAVDYNTQWVTPFSGAYADLTGAPAIPADLTDLGIADGASGTVLTTDGAGGFTFQAVGGGDVSFTSTGIPVNDAPSPINSQAGACSVTRFDGTTGNLIQSSLVTITDNGMILAPSVGSCIPFAWGSSASFPSAVTYRGALAHSNAEGNMYYADGTSWIEVAKAQDIPTNLADLADVDPTAPSTGQVLKWNGTAWAPAADSEGTGGSASNSFATISVAGQSDVVADSSTDTLTLVAGSGISISTDATGDSITIAATGGGGGSMATRGTVSGSTGTLADAATGPINITGYKSYMLMKVQTSAAAWVRIYTSEAARIADASRTEGTDPSPGAGVIAEVITTGAQTVVISPGALGFNDESTVTTNIPVRVTNKSGSSANITVTLTVLQLEA